MKQVSINGMMMKDSVKGVMKHVSINACGFFTDCYCSVHLPSGLVVSLNRSPILPFPLSYHIPHPGLGYIYLHNVY